MSLLSVTRTFGEWGTLLARHYTPKRTNILWSVQIIITTDTSKGSIQFKKRQHKFCLSYFFRHATPTFHKYEVSHNILLHILSHIAFYSWRHSRGWFMKWDKCPNAVMFLKDDKTTYCTLSKSCIRLDPSIFVTKCWYGVAWIYTGPWKGIFWSPKPAVPILFASRNTFQERNSSRSTIVTLIPKAHMCIFGCF